MMTQEEYMKVQELRAAGWTIAQIAEEVGYHPATVSAWLRHGGPPARRATPADELVVDERWRVRIGQLLERNAALQGSSVMRVICAEGFDGSYQTLTRYLREVRGPMRGNGATTPAVTMRIETGPAEEFLCGKPHRNSYAARANMRRRVRRRSVVAGRAVVIV